MQMHDETMKAAVVKAVIDSLGPEKMQDLVTKAVADFIGKPRDNLRGYGPKPTALEEAFEAAVYELAHKTVKEQISENDALMTRIRACIQEAMERAFADDRKDAMITEMAAAIAAAFKAERY